MVDRKSGSVLNHPLTIALLAALLFGAATPASKALLQALPAFQLAGLLYLGAAVGVVPLLIKEKRFSFPWALDRRSAYRLLGAIGLGGVAGPLLLLFGLSLASAASVSLWLNLELIATVILGFLIFRDELHLAGWSATIGVVAAAVLLSVSEGHAGTRAGLLVGAACFCWGLDNHFTALITAITPAQITFWKGLVAGIVNLSIGIHLDPYIATVYVTTAAILVGVFSYGFSLVLYIASAQKLGAARSQIIFSSSPFFGVVLAAVFLGEAISPGQITAALIIAVSLALLFFEKHSHLHHHQGIAHEHWHRHDDGHHDHLFPATDKSISHSHWHEHEATTHAHPHYPDPQHRHEHEDD
jgi:drug/metabolite transporter (DMT)-like permease